MCNGFSILLADESGKKEFYINLIGMFGFIGEPRLVIVLADLKINWISWGWEIEYKLQT